MIKCLRVCVGEYVSSFYLCAALIRLVWALTHCLFDLEMGLLNLFVLELLEKGADATFAAC